MDTYAESKALAQSAIEDTDFIDETQEKYEESMVARQQKLVAQTQEFWNTLLDTNILNTGLELLTSIFEIANKILDVFRNIGGVFGEVGEGLGGIIGTGALSFGAYKIFESYKKNGSIVDAAKSMASTFKDTFDSVLDNGFDFGKILSSSTDEAFEGITKGATSGIKAMSLLQKSMLGIGVTLAAIGAATWVFDKLHESAEELADKVKSANKEYEKQQEVLRKNKATIDNIGAEYDVLSKGVNDAGENISLTSKEFERYHEICNQIAEMYPQLVRSYDAQGNAILNLKDGVGALNKEYEKAAQYQAADFWKNNAETYAKNYARSQGQQGGLTQFGDKVKSSLNLKNDTKEVYGTQYLVDGLTEAMQMTNDELREVIYKNLRSGNDSIGDYLVRELGATAKMSDEELGKFRGEIANAVAAFSAEIQQVTAQTRMIMGQYFDSITLEGGIYSGLDDNVIDDVAKLISSLPKEIIDSFEGDTEKMEQYVNGLINTLSDNSEAINILDQIYSLDGTESFDELKNILEVQVAELASILNQDENQLKIQLGLDDEDKFIKLASGYIDRIADKLSKQATEKINLLKNFEGAQVGDLDRQSASNADLKAAGYKDIKRDTSAFLGQVVENEDTAFVVSPILPDGSVLNKEEFTDYVNNTVLKGSEDVKGVTLAMFDKKQMTDATKQAHKFAKEIDLANDYAGDYNSTQKLAYAFMRDNNIATADELDLLWECVETTSSWAEALDKFTFENFNLEDSAEQIKALEDNLENVKKTIQDVDQAYNESMTSTGMTKESIENIERAFSGLEGYDYNKLFESTAEGIRLNVTELDRLSKAWEEQEASKYDSKLENLIDIYEQYCLKIADATDATERNKLIMERDGVAEQIREVQELTAMYDGLTNSVTDYFRSSQTNNKDHNFSRIAKDFEKMEKDFANGAIGTDDFKKYTQLFNFDDITNLNPEEIAKEYARVRELAMRYFTEDENGNGGKQGILNFMEDASKIMPEQIFKDADGNWTIGKDGFIDIEKLAEELDISEAMVLEFFNMAEYYGAQLDYSEETEFLKGMRKEAEAGKETLKGYADELKNTGLNAEDFQFNFGELDAEDELKAAIDYSAELRESLVNTFGEGHDVVKAFDSQVEYMNAKLGEVMQQSNIDFFVNIHDNGAFEQLSSDLDVLNKTYETDINISWGNQDPEYWKLRMADLSEVINNLPRDVNGKIDMESEGVQEALRLYDAALQKQQELNKPVVMQVDVSKIDDEGLQQGMTKVQELQSALNELARQKAEVQAGFNVDTSAAEANVSRIISNIQQSNPTISAGLNLDSIASDADNAAAIAQQRLNKVTPEMLAGLKLSEESLAEVEGYKPPDAELTVDADTELVKAAIDAIDADLQTTRTMSFTETGLGGIKSTFDGIKDKNVTITTTYKTVGSPPSGNGQGWVNGTANFGGRAYADGNIGAPRDEIALVGEEKPELRVNKRTGEWELLGENGAEFAKINKGDIIFNGKIFCHRI